MKKVIDVEPAVLNWIEPSSSAHKGTAVAINVSNLGQIIVIAANEKKASEAFTLITEEYADTSRMKEVYVISTENAG